MARDTLDDFTKDLLSAANDLQNGKYAKQFIRKEGSKLRKETVKEAKSKVKKKTGNLFKGIKRGKAFSDDEDTMIRVYGTNPKGAGDIAPHVHLLNNGHRIVDKNGREHSFKEGVHFFESALENFDSQFVNDIEGFVDDMLDNHGL